MSAPDAHIKFQYGELHKLDQELAAMRRWGVLEIDPGYQSLLTARGAAMGKLGLKLARTTTLVSTISGLSPGVIKLWADAELGWMSEARTKPGAVPVYKYVSDEVAEKIVKEELTHELEEFLMTPDPYLGE